MHGYDVVDPTRVNPELGGEVALEALTEALAGQGMGLLLDIVPNHMSVSDARNQWWNDVLRRGRESPFAAYFDIDWEVPGLEGRVLLPVLGDELDAVLARGELRVVTGAGGGAELAYFDARFPLAEAPARDADLAALCARQHYRLESWRTGLSRLNYRRFFDVSELAGLRQEDPDVFEATHALALDLLRRGLADGLRVDHVDGLSDPAAYLQRLRVSAGEEAWLLVEKILAPGEALPAWPVDGTTGYDFAALATGLFIDPAGEAELARLDAQLTGDATGFDNLAAASKTEAVGALFAAELARLERVAAGVGVVTSATGWPPWSRASIATAPTPTRAPSRLATQSSSRASSSWPRP